MPFRPCPRASASHGVSSARATVRHCRHPSVARRLRSLAPACSRANQSKTGTHQGESRGFGDDGYFSRFGHGRDGQAVDLEGELFVRPG